MVIVDKVTTAPQLRRVEAEVAEVETDMLPMSVIAPVNTPVVPEIAAAVKGEATL